MTSTPHAPGRLVAVGLGLLLVWSFALRFWYGSIELDSRRYWDERYGLENIGALLDGELRPANGYHPSLSYLPQAALVATSRGLYLATGAEIFRVRYEEKERGFTPTAYFLCRLLQTVFGTLSLYLVFFIGRRLFSPPVGLLAALVLSVVFWHIRQSVIYKPDILLVLTCLLAFALSLRAAERPCRGAYLLAGGAIGLALASKFNAGPIAIPLVVAALVGGWHDRRRWLWLVMAGALAAGVFLMLNPYVVLDLEIYTTDFRRTLRDYASKGVEHRSSHLYVLWHGFLSLISANFHGKIIGIVGLLGSIAFPAGLVERGAGRDRRLGWAMALSYIAAYAVLYSLSTTNPSPHNWLPLTPFVAIFAAAGLWHLWQRVAARWPLLRGRTVGAATVILLTALLAGRANLYAYREVIPTTWEEVGRYLQRELRPVPRRLIWYEKSDHRLVLRHGPIRAASRGVERLAAVAPELLDRADAEVFLATRLEGATSGFYQKRLAQVEPSRVRRFRAEWFRAHGPELVVITHPWHMAGDPVAMARWAPRANRLVARLPEGLGAGETVSLEIRCPRKLSVRGVTVMGEPVSLIWAGKPPGAKRLWSERFVVPERAAAVELAIAPDENPARRAAIRVWVHRWSHPGGGFAQIIGT